MTPTGWHIAKGKELKSIERRMEKSGFMRKWRLPKGHPLPNPAHRLEIIVKTDINFAWVFSPNKEEAKHKLEQNQASRFDEVISAHQHAEIVPLAGDFRVNTPDANLFIIP